MKIRVVDIPDYPNLRLPHYEDFIFFSVLLTGGGSLNHYENYRAGILTGKAMIVAYSRPIAMKIYKRILQLRPAWAEKVAVVMTQGNNDPEEWQEIIDNKARKDELARKFKDNESPLKIAIVVDMWLTGFDVPLLATMYVYKPMSGHDLMQAIARVNRVFRDKEGGLVVDYVGIASALKQAMNDLPPETGKIMAIPMSARQLILDCFLHHCTVINIKGESYRLKERKSSMRQKQQIVDTLWTLTL